MLILNQKHGQRNKGKETQDFIDIQGNRDRIIELGIKITQAYRKEIQSLSEC